MSLESGVIERKAGFRLAQVTVILAACVVILGAFTRLSDAGLGCPDWPGCYGHLFWPVEDHEVELANRLFPETPVEHDKTWPEMVHRYFAGTLGLFILALGGIAFRYRNQPDYPFRLPVALALLVIWQGLFGMWTVTLKLWPQVVTIHLLGGITTLTLLWLHRIRLSGFCWFEQGAAYRKLAKLKKAILFGVFLVFAQIALGGWVASNYAAFGCPEFPTCQGKWWPEMDFSAGFNIFQHIGPNYLGGLLDGASRAAIHMTHRIGALVVMLYLLWLCVKLHRTRSPAARRFYPVLLGVLALQIVLGISNVIFLLPLWVAVAHNFVGALLLMTMVTLSARVYMMRPLIKQVE